MPPGGVRRDAAVDPDGEGRRCGCCSPWSGGTAYGDREKFALDAAQATPRAAPAGGADRGADGRLAITDRQWQILDRVRLGLANKQIARGLQLSPATVRKRLENIYRTLDVQSRGAAVHVAYGETDGPFREVAA